MKRFAIACLALLALGMIPAISMAWEDPPGGTSVLMTAECAPSQVLLTLEWTVSQEPDAKFVGWFVERTVMGACIPEHRAVPLQPWPPLGESTSTFLVPVLSVTMDEVFRVWALTDTGEEVFIYWPQRHNFAHADCMAGPSTIGYMIDNGGYAEFVPCEDDCWWGLSFWDTGFPQDLVDTADSGQLVEIFGEFKNGMHGYYISYDDLTWRVSQRDCSTVSTPVETWGTVKALYR